MVQFPLPQVARLTFAASDPGFLKERTVTAHEAFFFFLFPFLVTSGERSQRVVKYEHGTITVNVLETDAKEF